MPDYEARWYVVHTYSGYENKVAGDLMTTAENRQLQDMILDVKVPTEIVTEKVVNRKGEETIKEVEHKIYPGYVFVKMVYTDETWYVVRNIRGCTGFVGPGSKPVPLTEAEVYRMGVEQRSVKVSYAVGDSVRIIDGPLEDCVGVVDELNTTNDKLPEFTQAVYWEHPFPVGGNPTQWRSAIYHEFLEVQTQWLKR